MGTRSTAYAVARSAGKPSASPASPPPGGGVVMAEILNVMEGFSPLTQFGNTELMHLQTEAMRRAYLDRNTFLGDPDFVSMPTGRLLAKWYAGTLRAGI